ncbi:MAG TPA: DUF4382 domain-containing protein [Chitinophagaceae bacterium]|nr:DUF4382 domain-containing protein [Chitinophagaceae bacterium]
MKLSHVLFWFVYLALALISLSSCHKEKGNSRLTVYLTDAPAAYDAVNIDIVRLEIKATDDFGEGSWQVLPFANPGVYNLLDFTNGMDTLLSSLELPAGRVSQLRMILGTNNSIVVDGTTMDLPLTTPSAQQTGLKFNIHADLRPGIEYKLWIDFDCARSVVLSGNGEYKLKPVIRTFTEATSGAISGVVLPAAAEAMVFATTDTDTLGAIPDPLTGAFLIRGVPPGINWKVTADGNNNYQDQSFENINVVLGETTVMDTITLVQ